ncbi:ABC transporter permease [Paenibacillus cymbidii]|uniref:ABC transporter permease n=1 Tax=Paenibacillus cymbidii TaxID=1639034 RepID=UPI001081278E|nr:ABC transporter permease subunit [Paenibacillus cymbidii]
MHFRKRNTWPLHLMILPGFILVLIYSYGPLAGMVIAFQKFVPARGLFGHQQWVGWANFDYALQFPGTLRVVWNTLYIASMKIVAGLLVPVVVALMLNEVIHAKLKRTLQTIVYLPHFLSWVLLSGILIDILSPGYGLVNAILRQIGVDPIYFLGDNRWFPYTLVVSDVWKEFGFGTIVYLASITSINPQLYEAAVVDGANRWRQTVHITLPGMRMIIVLMTVLSLGNVLNAGFEQVFNLYSPQVYESGDIIDTFVYRVGLLDNQFGFATAIGLFKSVVSFTMISIAYYLAYRIANYRIF